MSTKKEISDRDLLKSVNQRLMRTGTSGQSRVTAQVRSGVVTLSGTLNYEIHRRAIVQAVARATGVRQVVDQMTLVDKKKF
jgi:osmotically-inducible protein OsmY